jgi:hypothetical protein
MDMYQILAQLNSVSGDSKQALTEGKKAKPDFLDVDNDGNKKESMKSATKSRETSKKDAEAAGNRLTENENGPVEAYGVKGVKSTPWRKVFRNQAAFEKWLDANEGNVEVHGTRQADAGSRVGNVKEADEMEVGKSRNTQHGKVTQVAPNVTRHTRDYGREEDTDADETTPKAKGRPAGSGKKIGAKGPTGRSKLMREEETGSDVQAAIELLMNNGYTVGKLGNTEEMPLDEKAVSKKQQRFMGMVHAAQKGEKPASKEVAKVAKSMGKKDAKDFASTEHKGLPEKKKPAKKKEVEETTTSGSVASAPGDSKKSKGGVYGQGVYEAKLAESFEAHLNSVMGGTEISIDDQGNMKVTVGGSDESGLALDQLSRDSESFDSAMHPEVSNSSLDDILALSGVAPSSSGYEEVCPDCGSADCACDMVDEAVPANSPSPQYSDIDTMVNKLSGGLNGPKSTGQTTGPIINRDPARQGVSAVAETLVKETESRLWQLYKQLNEGRMSEVDQIFQDIATGDMDIYELYQAHATDPVTKYAQDKLQSMYDDVAREHRLHPDDDFEDILDLVAQHIEQDYGNDDDSVPLH